MNFAILTESKYFETTLLNVQQIRRFHPESEIFIGDVGLRHNESDAFHDYSCNMNILNGFGLSEMDKMLLKPKFVATINTPTLFMDADTVLMKPMDLDLKGDMVVTVRSSKYGKVNSGVFIANNLHLIEDWIHISKDMAEKTGDRLSEQNALNWIYENSKYKFHEVHCSIYNYPKVEKGIPDDVVVVHLKSGRYKDQSLVQKVRDKCQNTM